MMIIAVLVSFVSPCPLFAQSPNVKYIKGYLSGHEFQVTYREGGPVYGTFFFLDIHFCASGRYLLAGQSRKQTVLGNEQVNNWNDGGNWDVVIVQGYPALRYAAMSGAQDLVPLQVLPDGSVRPLSGAFMQRIGYAQCR
jgi:hypothetical protein